MKSKIRNLSDIHGLSGPDCQIQPPGREEYGKTPIPDPYLTISPYFFGTFRSRITKKVVTLSAGQGKMPEWSIGPHSKCGERATVPRVRIPVFPPRQKLPVKFCPSKWGLLKSFVKFTKQNSRLRYLLQRNGKAGKIHFPSIRENCVFRRWHPCAVLTARD